MEKNIIIKKINSKNLLWLSFVLFLIISINGQSQDIPPGFSRIIPPSPNASSLGKYGEIPVSLYTGIPSIEIPLWEAKGRKLSLPLSLSYHSGGFKVGEMSGWTGLGWSLIAGGVITRTVKGKADDGSSPGYYISGWDSLPYLGSDPETFEEWQPYFFWNNNDTIVDYYLRNIAQGNLDTEPDMFFFNFNGLSGKFVFDVDGKVIVLSQKKIKIEVIELDPSNRIKTWKISTQDGIKYYFGGEDEANEKTTSAGSSYGQAVDNSFFYSSWFLYKIETPDNTDSISLSYSSYDQVQYRYPIFQKKEGCQSPDTDTIRFFTKHNIDRKFLSQINTVNETITFFKSSKFTFGETNGYTEYGLDKITIKSLHSNQIIKEYDFDYELFDTEECPTSSAYVYYPCDKLKLSKIYESPGDGEFTKPPWSFQYNSTTLPLRGSFSQDHWGYYNGKLNTDLIPTVYVDNSDEFSGYVTRTINGEEKFLYDDLEHIKLSLYNSVDREWKIEGADRRPSETYSKAGVLNKITYPTGGSTSFEYELHDFSHMSKKAPSCQIEAYSANGDNNTNFTLKSGREIEIVPLFYTSGTVVSDAAEVYIDQINRGFDENDTTLYSMTYENLEDNYGGGEIRERIWLPHGDYSVHASAYSQDIVIGLVYADTSSPSLSNITYPIYSMEYEAEEIEAGYDIFIDDSAYYCSEAFSITAEDENIISINYQFKSVIHPNYISITPFSLTSVRIVDSQDNEKFLKNYYDEENDSIQWNGTYHYLTGVKTISLEEGNYTIEFDPRIKDEMGFIQVSYMQAQDPSNYQLAGGLRVKKIITNDGVLEDNNIEKEFSYRFESDSTQSSGILHSYPPYYKPPEELYYLSYEFDYGDCFSMLELYSTSQAQLGATQGGHIGYSEVSVKNNGGKTINKFTSDLEYPDITNESYPYTPAISYDWKRGHEKERKEYDASEKIKYKEKTFYNSINDTIKRKYIPAIVAVQEDPDMSADYRKYQILSGWNYLTKKITYTYDSQGLNPLVDSVRFYYENPNHLQLTKTVTNKSNGEEIINKNFYPLDFTLAEDTSSDPSIIAIALMKDDLHMHNVVLEQQELVKVNQEEKLIKGTVTKYKEWEDDQVLPEKIYQLEASSPLGTYKSWKDSLILDPNYTLRSTIKKYDTYGHLLEYENEENIPVSYKWYYQNTLPVAKAVNSLYDSISGTFPNFQAPADAQLTIYKYIPLVGVSEVIDENGVSTYYDYDEFGRLKLVKDDESYIISQYAYNYDTDNYESVSASSISAGSSQIPEGGSTLLSVQGGSLGDGASWQWYSSSCGSTYIGEGSSITVSPVTTTNYYVRAEGLYNTTSCVSCTITVLYPEINVKQSATSIPDGTGSFSFGNVNVDASLSKTFTIENLGGASLTLGTGSENSSQFSISDQPDSQVYPSSSTTFQLVFSPTSTGSKSATFTISNNDNNENPYNFSITGEGVALDANFTHSASRIPTNIRFTDTSTGSPTSWEWDFDNDGTTDSTLQNPSYNFGSGGSYPVKLTIHKGGDSDYIVKTVMIVI